LGRGVVEGKEREDNLTKRKQVCRESATFSSTSGNEGKKAALLRE
jgi:hypothetical protein